MSTVETVVFAVLWFSVLTLGALLLLLYRQVDRAYRVGASSNARTLPAGSVAPPIEIVDGANTRFLDLDGVSLSILVFLETGCPSCRELLPHMKRDETARIVALVSGDSASQDFSADCEIYWLSHPPDVIKNYGIGSYPTAYVLRDSVVKSGGPLGSVNEFPQLLSNVAADAVSKQ